MSCHASAPPLTVGVPGSVRSIRTVLPAVADAGAQADCKPVASTARNCTSVWPWLPIVTDPPFWAVVQVVPPSVELRCW